MNAALLALLCAAGQYHAACMGALGSASIQSGAAQGMDQVQTASKYQGEQMLGGGTEAAHVAPGPPPIPEPPPQPVAAPAHPAPGKPEE